MNSLATKVGHKCVGKTDSCKHWERRLDETFKGRKKQKGISVITKYVELIKTLGTYSENMQNDDAHRALN